MQIPLDRAGKRAPNGFDALRPRVRTLLLIVGALALGAGAATLGGIAGVNAERRQMLSLLDDLQPLRIVRHFVGSFGATPDRLVIDIKHKHYEKLRQARELAVDRGQITADLKEYVPATIRFGDESFRVKLRLKGEWIDHVTSQKWSFRVNLRGGETLLGMSSFAIQHPRTRKYIHEWLYQRALAREDVAGLRYRFVAVTVNGKDLGIYALEEHLTRQMIEQHNHRREGVVVRLDADYRYAPHSNRPGILRRDPYTGIQSESSAEVLVYDEDELGADPGLAQQAELARNLLEAFREGRLETHQVFDVEKLARYFAISELNGSVVTMDDWSDHRFLYDPITSRLEPIGMEGLHEPLIDLMGARFNGASLEADEFHARMFSDPVFFRRYVQALERVSEPGYVSQLFEEVGPDLEQQLRILHREWPYRGFDRKVLYENAKFIRALIHPRDGLRAYARPEASGRCALEVAAIQPFPVELVEAVSEAGAAAELGALLNGKPAAGRLAFRDVSFEPGAARCPDFARLRYRLLGLPEIREVPVLFQPRLDEGVLASEILRAPSNVADFDWIAVNEAERTLEIRPGRWRLARSLVVPAGYTLRAGPGVEIDLRDGALILSRSRLDWQGDPESPVVVESSDGSGQGIFVTDAEGRSRVQHVVFRGLGEPRQGGWRLTGAVTFHRSPVDIDQSEFVANRSEDGLNVIHSEFSLTRSHFRDTPSDAFDGDYVSGRIHACSFIDIAGDAVDVSGSLVELEAVRIARIGDKGVSVGEQSTLTGRDVSIEQAGIGVASKDLSRARFDGLRVTGARIGLAAFQKKAEFGGGWLSVEHYVGEDVEQPELIEVGSTVEVNGSVVHGDRTQLAQQIYGSEG